MKNGRFADFFFVGLGVLPVTLLLSGYPELAVMLFVPLLLAACLFGAMEQIEGAIARTRDEARKHDAGDARKKAPGLTFRKSEGGSRKAEE
jgi:HAMP domain-containing protein